MSIKQFSLDKISDDTATEWIKKASELKSKTIIVSYPWKDNHFEPHYVTEDNTEAEIYNEIDNAGETQKWELDVETAIIELAKRLSRK